MKLKTLVLLVIAAAVLGVLAWRTQRPAPTPETHRLGAKLLPGLPINLVHKLVLISSSATTTLAKVNGVWTAPDRFGYPAKFDRIADSLRQLADLTIGQLVAADAAQRAALNLVDPTAGDAGAQAGTRVELRDERGGLLASLLVGKPFLRAPPRDADNSPFSMGAYPDGQYVQTGDGRIVLVGATLERLAEPSRNWLDDQFLSVNGSDLASLSITGPDRAPVRLARATPTGPLALEGLADAEGTLNAEKVTSVSGALSYLRFDDVADPALTPAQTGLDRPVLFEASARNGTRYTLSIGGPVSSNTPDRYVRVAVAYTPPPDTDAVSNTATQADSASASTQAVANAEARQKAAADAAALNARLSPWTYLFKTYRTEPMLTERSALIKKPEPKQDAQPAATNAAPAAAAGPAKAPAKPPAPPKADGTAGGGAVSNGVPLTEQAHPAP